VGSTPEVCAALEADRYGDRDVDTNGDTDAAVAAGRSLDDLLIGMKASNFGGLEYTAPDETAALSRPFNDSLVLDFSSNSRREIFKLVL
jgi:hypothetical protein